MGARWTGRLALAVMLAAVITTGASAQARRHTLTYDVYAGGLEIASLNIGIDIAPSSYDVRVSIKTVGLLAVFAPWWMKSYAEGGVEELKVRPVRAGTTERWGGRNHWQRIEFTPDGLASWQTSRGEPKKQIPEPFRRGVFDIASAITQVIVEMDRGATCGQSVPVFDGRRRYDFQLSPVERVWMERTSYSVFQGEAWKCRIGARAVHGKLRKGGIWDRANDKALVWIARIFPQGAPVPVRLQARSRYGTVMIHLVRAELHGPGAPQLVERAR